MHPSLGFFFIHLRAFFSMVSRAREKTAAIITFPKGHVNTNKSMEGITPFHKHNSWDTIIKIFYVLEKKIITNLSKFTYFAWLYTHQVPTTLMLIYTL